MTPNSLTDDPRQEPGEKLDRLLADFFHSQLPKSWPAAPGSLTAEPAVLVAGQASKPDGLSHPPRAARDGIGRARYTLVFSVLLLLGTCWFFANGTPTTLMNGRNEQPGTFLKGAEASKPAAIEEIRKVKATGTPNVTGQPRVTLP